MSLSHLPCRLVLVLGLGLALPLVASAADNVNGVTGGKELRLPRLDAEPLIDGRLDEAVWQQAAVTDDFHQMVPQQYAAPSQRTEVRVFYTATALYVGARLYDSDPSLIRANAMRQGQALANDDVFNLILDPNFDRRSGYLFEINANGVRGDGIYQDVSQLDRNWSSIWQGTASIDELGWSVELRIPYQSLSFNPQSGAWGINFRRAIRRNNEEIGWISRNRLMNPSIAGTASGLSGLQQGLGLDVVPYFIARREKIFGNPGQVENAIEPQLDLFYKLTPRLNAALTLNTDFSATEVDDRVVNLTRFSLFFPERRDFFTRDSDIFQFGRIGNGALFGQEGNDAIPSAALQNGRPFFSRNIGLSSRGTPVDLNVGAKLSGRAGGWDVGALVVNQAGDELANLDQQTVFVGRAALNVLQESQVGVIATGGDPRQGGDNSLLGADFRYRNSRLPGGKVVEGELWYQQSNSDFANGDPEADAAWGFGLSAPNTSGWRGGYSYKRIEDSFNPALGFVNQRGIKDHALDGGYRYFLPPGGAVRSFYVGVDGYRNSSLNPKAPPGPAAIDEPLNSQIIDLRANANNNTNDVLSVAVIRQREVLVEDFGIYRSSAGDRVVIIPPGDYSFTHASASLSFGGQRPLSGSLSIDKGDYYDGENFQRRVSGTWQPRPGYSFTLSYSENVIELPGGNFTVRQPSFSSLISFTPDLSWSNRVQYDNVSETVGINSRLYWIAEPGREAYLVLNWGLADTDKDNNFRSTNNDLTLKYNYTFRF
ncbi:MAG: carbohydrate binding family 9 domain-containing protein [Pseudomonadales bacterium]|nr:carbohydrate binding family 9 domain-containing protein [Pseudomonadales bacterium]